MKKFLKVILTILGVLVLLVLGIGVYVKKALPSVGAPSTLKVQVTPNRVEHGRYLSNHVAACVACHSSRDTSIYSGPVRPETLGKGGELFGRDEGFPGNIYASNLTPYHLGNWTDGELFRAITSGVSKDGHALFPLMNYPAYGKMDQEDVFSIIAYLRTLPAINSDVPSTELDFPVSFIVNTIPSRPALGPKPDSNNASAYGKYLVTMASCVECHSKAERGKVVSGTEFGGGREFVYVDGRVRYSPNITPDKETGIGSWGRELFVRTFRQYADSGYKRQPVEAGKLNTPMPWMAFAGMREKDLAAIYAYLMSLKPVHNAVKRS